MPNLETMISDDNKIVIDSLIATIRDQSDELADLEYEFDVLNEALGESQEEIQDLKLQLAAIKKESKASKTPKSSIISKAEAQKISSAIGKRKPGRPKKVVK
jgi:predicted  nucleic acid-binding Zn-ribbon protein